MKILIVCENEMTASVFQKSIKKYESIDDQINAIAYKGVKSAVVMHDVVLLSPGIAYLKNDLIKKFAGIKISTISREHYNLIDIENILKQGKELGKVV